jgi:hypothetical protein
MFNTRGEHFSVGFHNGWTFSVTWMDGTYSSRRHAGSEDDEVTLVEAAAFITESKGGRPRDIVWFRFDAETAPDWADTSSMTDVYGWLTPEHVAEFMQIVANLDDVKE